MMVCDKEIYETMVYNHGKDHKSAVNPRGAGPGRVPPTEPHDHPLGAVRTLAAKMGKIRWVIYLRINSQFDVENPRNFWMIFNVCNYDSSK